MNDSKKAFFKAFDKLIADNDSTNFSVDELCNATGYKRQTFYYNFKSKQDFLLPVSFWLLNIFIQRE